MPTKAGDSDNRGSTAREMVQAKVMGLVNTGLIIREKSGRDLQEQEAWGQITLHPLSRIIRDELIPSRSSTYSHPGPYRVMFTMWTYLPGPSIREQVRASATAARGSSSSALCGLGAWGANGVV